jgi:hypothetical protein
MENNNKAFEIWEQWMIEDSKLFEELIEANKEIQTKFKKVLTLRDLAIQELSKLEEGGNNGER